MYMDQQSPQAWQPDLNHTDSVEVLFVVQRQELYWFTFINREMSCDSTQNRKSCLSSLSWIYMEVPVNETCHLTWRFQFVVIKPMLWNPTGNALTFFFNQTSSVLTTLSRWPEAFCFKIQGCWQFCSWHLFFYNHFPNVHKCSRKHFCVVLSVLMRHCLQHLNLVCLCFSSRWGKLVPPPLHTFTVSIIHRLGPVSHVLFRTLLSKPFLFFTTLNIGRQLWLRYVALFFMTCPDMAVISTYCKFALSHVVIPCICVRTCNWFCVSHCSAAGSPGPVDLYSTPIMPQYQL